MQPQTKVSHFSVNGRAFILDRKPIPHSDMLWRVQSTDGQVWFGVWHDGFTQPMFFDAPKNFILGNTPQECFAEFVRRRGAEIGPVLPEMIWVERSEARMRAIYGGHEK